MEPGNESGSTHLDGMHQFLTFTVGAEEYAIEILRVQEIKGGATFTPIPNAPAHIRGVMNLRGTVVPVIDLRARFGMPPAEGGASGVVIVVSVGRRAFGLAVDGVSDVRDVAPDALGPTPDLGPGADVSLLRGMARCGEALVPVLDVDRIVGEAAADDAEAA